jgi:hypothetical protein
MRAWTPAPRAHAVLLSLLIGAGVGVAAPCAAQTPAPPESQSGATIMGAGGQSCSHWLDARAQDGEDAQANEAWVEGFLSALATTLPHPDALAGGTTPDVLMWMDGYCADNPNDLIGRAATIMFLQLRTRADAPLPSDQPPPAPPPKPPPATRDGRGRPGP